jgi:NADH-quinone oxidoreductase subunit A
MWQQAPCLTEPCGIDRIRIRTDDVGFLLAGVCETIHKVAPKVECACFSHVAVRAYLAGKWSMQPAIPIFLFALCAAGLSIGLLVISRVVGPREKIAPAKEMPYESGMNPIHDTRRRFDVRFHLVAIAFLLFDVEVLFLYPWAVANRNPAGIDRAVETGLVAGRGLVFAEAMIFIALLFLGFVYAWRRGVFRWR